MYFRILGAVDVVNGQGRSGRLPSSNRRAILAALLLQSGRYMSTDELATVLWDSPPASCAANIRSHLTGLRNDLAEIEPGMEQRLETLRGGQGGYRIRAAPGELDLQAFGAAARRGRKELLDGQVEVAIDTLAAAVDLWRGPFGQGLPCTRWLIGHASGLNNARLDACEDLFAGHILAGRSELLSYRIETAVAEAPYRQRLWQLLTAAHYVNGDMASALSVVERCRERFADDLGIDPPPGVMAVQHAALNWDHNGVRRLVAPEPPQRTHR